MLSPADVAELANVSRKTVYREIDRGALPAQHVGRQSAVARTRAGLGSPEGGLDNDDQRCGRSVQSDPIEREDALQARELRRKCDHLALEAACGFDPELVALVRA